MRYLLAVFSALAVLLAGCANGNVAKARQISLAALKVNTAAIEAFKKFDYEFQKHVVDTALKVGTDQAVAEAEQILAAYRAKRGEVIGVFNKFFNVIQFGNALIPLVESGVQKESELKVWMDQLAVAGKELQQVLASLGLKIPFPLPF